MTSTERSSAGPRARTQASQAIRSSCTRGRSANSSTSCRPTRRSSRPSLDHFGLEVASKDELATYVERARSRKRTDDRVRIIEIESRTTAGSTHDYTLTSAYIGFLLPLMVELQHLERRER